MRLNLNSTEESDIKEECLDGVKVIYTHNDFVAVKLRSKINVLRH